MWGQSRERGQDLMEETQLHRNGQRAAGWARMFGEMMILMMMMTNSNPQLL